MKQLSVFDLDETLITRDSLRYLMLRHFRPVLLPLVAKRLLGFVDSAGLTEGLIRIYARELADPAWVAAFCADLKKFIDPAVLLLVEDERKFGAMLVLVSASPQAYVGPLAALLGMAGHGSGLDGQGRYFHCKGAGKLALLDRLYPASGFSYRLAISDSPSDISLLKRFEIGYLYSRKTLEKITP